MKLTQEEQMERDGLQIGDRVIQTYVGGFGAGKLGELIDQHGTLVMHNGTVAVRLDDGRIVRYWAAWYGA